MLTRNLLLYYFTYFYLISANLEDCSKLCPMFYQTLEKSLEKIDAQIIEMEYLMQAPMSKIKNLENVVEIPDFFQLAKNGNALDFRQNGIRNRKIRQTSNHTKLLESKLGDGNLAGNNSNKNLRLNLGCNCNQFPSFCPTLKTSIDSFNLKRYDYQDHLKLKNYSKNKKWRALVDSKIILPDFINQKELENINTAAIAAEKAYNDHCVNTIVVKLVLMIIGISILVLICIFIFFNGKKTKKDNSEGS